MKCIKYCLKTENGCLKTQTKHPLKISHPIAVSLLLSFCHFPENIPAFYGGPFSFSISTMVTICQKCGDRGFSVALIYCDRCSVYAQHRYDLFAVCWFAFLAMCVRSRVRLDTIVQKNKIKDYGSILAYIFSARSYFSVLKKGLSEKVVPKKKLYWKIHKKKKKKKSFPYISKIYIKGFLFHVNQSLQINTKKKYISHI